MFMDFEPFSDIFDLVQTGDHAVLYNERQLVVVVVGDLLVIATIEVSCVVRGQFTKKFMRLGDGLLLVEERVEGLLDESVPFLG